MEIPRLPYETFCNIAQESDRSTLRTLRLVSRQSCAAATRILFSKIFIKPDRLSLKHIVDLMTDDSLRNFPRSLLLSFPVCDHCRQRCDCEETPSADSTIEYFTSIMKLVLTQFFNKAHTLEVVFPRWHNSCNKIVCRFAPDDILHGIFGLLIIRRKRQHLRPIDSLQIEDLTLGGEGKRMPHERYQREMREAINTLQSLHITIRAATWHTEPLINLYYEIEHLWLSNPFPYLKSLYLGMDETAWGAKPLFKTSHLQFPVLENLTLRNYMLLYRSQLAWILSIDTLKSLTLWTCSIPWLIKTTAESRDLWKLDTTDWIKLKECLADYPYREGTMLFYQNSMRWNHISAQIADHLPNLEHLQVTGISTASCLLQPVFQATWTPPQHILDVLACFGNLTFGKFQGPINDFAEYLYSVASDDNLNKYPSKRWTIRTEPPCALTKLGPVWEDRPLVSRLDPATLRHVGGAIGTDYLWMAEAFTDDFAALAELFDTVNARAFANRR